MPWQPSDARRHTKKATSPKSQRQWSHVADSALSRGASEGSAIRQANAVVARRRYDEGGTVPALSWADRLHRIQNRVRQGVPQNIPRIVVPQDPGVQDPQELSESDALDNIKRLMDQRVQTIAYDDGGPVYPKQSLADAQKHQREAPYYPFRDNGTSDYDARARIRVGDHPLEQTLTDYIARGPQPSSKAAGGPISPLASIVGNPLQMRSSLPKLGGGVGLARMRMPHIPLADTMHNIDQRMAGARVKLPKLQAAVGGRAKRKRSVQARKGRV